MRAYFKYYIILLIPIRILFAQNHPTESAEEIIHKFINSSTIEKENSDLYDLIEYYLENPINLNEATKIDLMNLPFADINEINNLIEYREKNGRIFSFAELKNAKIISEKFVNLLSLFTKLTSSKPTQQRIITKKHSFKFRSRVSYNLQEREGFTNGLLNGNPLKTYNRAKYNYRENIQSGILLEKDAGEISYYNFAPFYIQVKNILNHFHILAGYFTIEFGQGLALWSPYSFSKSSDATNSVIKRARSVTPYISAGEISFFKGAALQFQNSFLNFSSFYSIKNNNLSLPDRNTFGATLSFSPHKNYLFSLLYFYDNENHHSIPKNKGDEYFSFAYKSSLSNLFLTGEFSLFNNSLANINILQISLLRNFVFIASIRNYPSNYKSIYAHGFGESNRTNNEFGFYFGVKLKSKIGFINIYFDQFKNLEGNTFYYFSNRGNELSISYLLKTTTNSSIYIRYFNENKDVISEIENTQQNSEQNIQKLRLEFFTNISGALSLKSRIEILSLNNYSENERGFLIFQDLKYKLKPSLILQGRIIFFNTESYKSRIYEFENDLIGVMTNQPLWGEGIKWYFLMKYNLLNNLNLSLKYSELYKPTETSLGSGINEIEGNLDNKFSFQFDFHF